MGCSPGYIYRWLSTFQAERISAALEDLNFAYQEAIWKFIRNFEGVFQKRKEGTEKGEGEDLFCRFLKYCVRNNLQGYCG